MAQALAKMDDGQLITAVKGLIEKGDKAREKAEQFYIAAGQHLNTLKEGKTQAEFLEIVKEQIGLGKTRTYEILAIADGRTTAERIREADNAKKAKSREEAKAVREVPDNNEGEDDTANVVVGRFHDGLSGGDPSRHANVPNKKKEADSSYPLGEEASAFIRSLHKAVYVEFATKFVGWYDKNGSELNQDTRHALEREIDACALELERIAKTLK